MRTKGIAQIRIDIGDHQFLHGFHVILFGSHKAIIGNDLLIAQDAIIYPKHCDTNSTWEHIPCFNVNPKPDYDHIQIVSDSHSPTMLRKADRQSARCTIYGASSSKIPAKSCRTIFFRITLQHF